MSKVVVFGNATVDLIFNLARWPSEGETVLADAMVQSAGGKGLNQAVAAARFGVPVRLLAPVGHDVHAAFLQDVCSTEEGLSPTWITRDLPTDISTIWIADRGENVIVSSAQCVRSVSAADATALLCDLSPGDILLLQGNLTAETTAAALREARDRDVYIILNTAPIWWNMEEVMPLCHLVICNEPEAKELGAGDDASRRELRRKFGIDLIVTLGRRGAQGVFSDGDAHYPAVPVKAVDTSGAGDLTVGAIAASLQMGRAISDAVQIGMRAAALCVTRPGTLSSFPSASEIEKLL